MKTLSGSAVPRHMVFVLGNGEPVVQWTELHVQELLSGKYRPYDISLFGHPILDHELEQLKASGRVEHYNRQYIWLYALPENNRFALRTQDAARTRQRAFYINTTLPPARLAEVQAALTGGLATAFTVREHDDLVTVWGKGAAPFPVLSDAEDALRWLNDSAPHLFRQAALAFIDTPTSATPPLAEPETIPPLEALLSVLETTEARAVQIPREAVVALTDPAELVALTPLLADLHIALYAVNEGYAALRALEDRRPPLLIMDVALPDLHGWQMLLKARESRLLTNTAVIMIGEAADNPAAGSDTAPAFALAVAGVDEYLPRPLNLVRLRSAVVAALKSHGAL